MTLLEIMVNLCIGISGGIFSSIIVSKIFLIQSLYFEQISRVQEHFEYLYGLDGLIFYYPCILKDYKCDIDALNNYLLKKLTKMLCRNAKNFVV